VTTAQVTLGAVSAILVALAVASVALGLGVTAAVLFTVALVVAVVGWNDDR
jgi:hypothetical protein